MASSVPKVRGRPAHSAGPTYLAYSTDGSKLVTAGTNNHIRVYETGSDGEPTTIDDCQDNNLAVAATDDFFLSGAEDGTVSKTSLKTNLYEELIVRCSLPIRDVAISPDGVFTAVASDEVVVKVVDNKDTMRMFELKDHQKPAKHVSWDSTGTYLSLSGTDGIIYVYSFSTDQPKLVQRIEGAIRALETDSEASSQVIWHPDGKVMAAPTASREIGVFSTSGGEKVRTFTDGHLGDVTSLAWSPNGAFLVSAGKDDKILLWDSQSRSVISRYDYPGVLKLVWHPTENLVSFTTKEGELFMHKDFVPIERVEELKAPLRPFLSRQALGEVSGNAQKALVNGSKPPQQGQPRRRRASLHSLDSMLGGMDEDEDDFVVDDDGAGYALNGNGKRGYDDIETGGYEERGGKRRQVWEPSIHKPFQPGSTPWRGNRRYLCLNLVGFVWTVDQETHHTVTVEFYDREFHRDLHFTDPYRYDKACLNQNGALFSCPAQSDEPAMVYYRPHETWTARADWRIQLPAGEDVSAIALSESFITVTTSANYVRVYTLFGTPFRIYRQKASPAVTCAAWRDYVLTMGNGPIGATGRPSLLYSIENVRRDEVCQSNDTVPLPEGVDLKSVFFSDAGDPCIYDTDGVLLICQHWRTPGQARWVPLLDTKLLDRLASGKKEETYWPVAVAGDRYHCIILKGGDQHPYFPRPLLSEFEFKIPISSIDAAKGSHHANGETEEERAATAAGEGPRLEEAYVRSMLEQSLLEDLLASTHATSVQRLELGRREVESNKALLQLLNVECREGEERGMKALEIVGLLRDPTGRMLEAAGKIAARYGLTVLEEKIRELAEGRLMGEDGGDD